MLVGIVGFIGCGKGTVASQLVQNHNFRQDSFAASLKDACACLFDWPRHLLEGDTLESRAWRESVDPWWANKLGIPNLTPRYVLQHMGTEVLRDHFHPDMWFLTLQNRARKNPAQHVVISDVRFPNEVDFLRKQNGILVRVNRGPTPIWYETAVMANKGNSLALQAMKQTYAEAHMSEWAWVGSKVDFVIDNNGTLETLGEQVNTIISSIL